MSPTLTLEGDALVPVPSLDIPRRQLADIAVGLGRSPLWRKVVVHDPARRRPVRLLATDAYEVWVTGWTTGQGLGLHDHGDAAGVFTVVEGALEEVELDGEGRAHRRSIRTGGLRSLPPGTVHGVGNTAAARATSIHVYSPPLTTMTSYAGDGTRLPTTPVLPVPALLSGGSSVLAHPSVGMA